MQPPAEDTACTRVLKYYFHLKKEFVVASLICMLLMLICVNILQETENGVYGKKQKKKQTKKKKKKQKKKH